MKARAAVREAQLGPDACWPWNDAAVRSGKYGKIGGKLCTEAKAWTVTAHRVSFRVFVGPIPPGLEVRHRCDWPPCFNPRHLEVGTHRENIHDAVERERMARGERHGRVRLTDDAVVLIRQRVRDGETQAALAREYGVNPATVQLLVCRKNWKHIE